MGLPQSFPQNPQFLLSTSSNTICTISLVLSQHPRGVRDELSLTGMDYKSLYIFRISDLGIALNSQNNTAKIRQTPRQKYIYKKFDSFQNSRDISLEFQVLPPSLPLLSLSLSVSLSVCLSLSLSFSLSPSLSLVHLSVSPFFID
jgi:hypothetical protein